MNLLELQTHLRGIYGDRNRRKGNLGREFFLAIKVSITATRIAKSIRDGKTENAKGSLAMLIAWLIGHHPMGAESLGSIIFRHYPGRCPYRCQSSPCQCKGDKGVRMKPLEGTFPEMSIAELQKMFKEIYPNCTTDYSPVKITEEVAEWQEALTHYLLGGGPLAKVEEELADIFAHCFGLANALGISLEDLLTQVFEHGCPACNNPSCGCESFKEVKADSVPAYSSTAS